MFLVSFITVKNSGALGLFFWGMRLILEMPGREIHFEDDSFVLIWPPHNRHLRRSEGRVEGCCALPASSWARTPCSRHTGTCTAGCSDTAMGRGEERASDSGHTHRWPLQFSPHHAGHLAPQIGPEMRPCQIKMEGTTWRKETKVATDTQFLPICDLFTSSCLNGSSLLSRTSESTHLSQ